MLISSPVKVKIGYVNTMSKVWDIEEFKKKYPHLAKEILGSRGSVHFRIGVRVKDPWRGYDPNVYDFIRRADTVEQALEVVDFLEKRGELSHEEAEKIRKQLREKGLQSFGPKKEFGYYLKAAGYE
ncbi:MAG TPA: DUF2095 domain-containing protein [Acidilobales archaeon]|nr:DUF2095 domain-containing protein [Acidilobales archaeon]